ncbi:MAG: FkbM family methyltransferase [Terriglobales bacterium]
MEELDGLLAEPLDAVVERERTAFDRLLATCDGQLVLFGAGSFGRKALQSLRGGGIEPLAFSDNGESKWGTEVDGIPVLSPSDAANRYGTSTLFVVTIWSKGHFYPDTQSQLRQLGCRHIEPASTLRWKFASQLLPDFWQDLPHKLYEEASHVRAAASLWSDHYSRDEYLRQVRLRTHGDFTRLCAPLPDQYFPQDILRLSSNEVFVDCGAFDGDTLLEFVRHQGSCKQMVAIEADPENYRRLCARASSLNGVRGRITTYNVAVGKTSGTVRFRSTGGEGACVANDGETVIPQAALDDLLPDLAPTYIKMDIEGAEMEALAGAQRLIRQYRPMLAVCLYHKPWDLWSIPLFIRSLQPDYRLFLRPHAEDGWDCVCYAVPPERAEGAA